MEEITTKPGGNDATWSKSGSVPRRGEYQFANNAAFGALDRRA